MGLIFLKEDKVPFQIFTDQKIDATSFVNSCNAGVFIAKKKLLDCAKPESMLYAKWVSRGLDFSGHPNIMPSLIIQLSDLHAKSESNTIYPWVDELCRAIDIEIRSGQIETAVIVFNGDAAFKGIDEEFRQARHLLLQIRQHLQNEFPLLKLTILTIPGNHDCDFITIDQDARNTLRKGISDTKPSESVLESMLSVQDAYFKFTSETSSPDSFLTPASPFYKYIDIGSDDAIIRFHLLNSAWTSKRQESDDLGFPINEFCPPDSPTAAYSIAVIHHPISWFQVASVRRPLRNILETTADLILVGHEHENEASRRQVHGGPSIEYLEGGVLHDAEMPDQCTFNIIKLDLKLNQILICNLKWTGTHFDQIVTRNETTICHNAARSDRKYQLNGKFESYLDELEDPLVHPREEHLSLPHIFAFPDLRRSVHTTSGDDNASKSAHIVERIKSEDVFAELLKYPHILITGGDKSGKTCLLKQLYLGFLRQGLIPVLLRGDELVRSGNVETVRKHINKKIQEEYLHLSASAYEQLDRLKRVALVDDIHNLPSDPAARARIIGFLMEHFGACVLTANDELDLTMSYKTERNDVSLLLRFHRYEIIEFGKQRLEYLALRWTALGQPDTDPEMLRTSALEMCDRIQSILATAGLPHTPWLLTVIFEQGDSPEGTLAARNGDTGHLYQAVITARLAHSKLPRFNLNGKFSFLSELAYDMYKRKKPILTIGEAREFYNMYSAKFDFEFDFQSVFDDLVDTQMLRRDGPEIAFRQKHVYSFWVGYWLSRNIFKDESQILIKDLCSQLHHDVAANILVFLSHLTDQPIVLDEMRKAASRLFERVSPANMESDAAAFNSLTGAEGLFKLPSTSPEVNRKIRQDEYDHQLAIRGKRDTDDGRRIKILPELIDGSDDAKSFQVEIRELRAALRTIRILGQVLRNKALSTEAKDKKALLNDIISLGMRTLGKLFTDAGDLKGMIAWQSKRLMSVLVQEKLSDLSDCESSTSGEQDMHRREPVKLRRQELREMWSNSKEFSRRFIFDLFWLGSFGMIKRLAEAVGSRDLDLTLAKARTDDKSLPFELVDYAVQLGRRNKWIPSDNLIRLHKRLFKDNNKLSRVVLEALTWERLLMIDTEISQKQSICQQMQIGVPKDSLDPSRKRFS